MAERRAQDVLDFWFGRKPTELRTLTAHMRMWFGGDDPPEVRRLRDEDIESRFKDLVLRAADGEIDAWATSPHRCLALILVQDQFPRNIYRGTAQAFELDARALALTLSGMQTGADAALTTVERIFFYMPLQHAESTAAQDESVLAYRRLLEESPPNLREVFVSTLQFAELHRDLIRRFGRFPHRNAVLGRDNTADEQIYLRENPESFGQ